LLGVRNIIVHDHTPGYREPIKGYKKLIKIFINSIPFFTADTVIGVSPYVCSRLKDVTCAPERKIHLVTNGIEDTIVPAPTGIDDPRPTKIVTVARANYYKGIDFAIKTIALLKETLPDIEYTLIGDGPNLEEFKALAKELGVDDKVVFAGKCDNVAERLSHFDIAFHPSKGEAMCLAIVEYMRAGLPIIVSTNKSVNSILHDGIDGSFYTEASTRSASEKLLALIFDSKHRIKMGHNARSSFLEKYNHSQMKHQFSRLICQKIIDNQG
jgi:glycosyltransferase involved in cell wall biosynthesis